MHPRHIPGSNVHPGVAAAFVIALILLVLFTDPGVAQGLVGG